ncbi:MAG: hypothetical protein WKF47_03655 [Geodermatophilaceae bacterium]
MVLTIGAQHPSTHGVLRLRLVLDGDRIRSAEPIIGYLHRGAEKLFEVRDYRQILVLTNRHDWLSAFSNELGVVLAVERMLGLEVPQRATWLRTLLAELNRVLSHLMFLGSDPLDSADNTPPDTLRGREVVQAVDGGGLRRAHPLHVQHSGRRQGRRPVGMDRPGPARRRRHPRPHARHRPRHPGQRGLRDPHRGIGQLSRETAIRYGVSGPVARASGLDLDLRRDEPYLAYGELGAVLRVVTRTSGDCLARFECLLEQVSVSLDLADACLDRVGTVGGPVNVRLPKTVKALEGHTYAWTENPLGINGYYLVSRGEKTPWRLKLRSASFNNVQVLRELLPGTRLRDLVTVLASMFFIVGDIDK